MTPAHELQDDCTICGGYLPRRKRTAGLHELCQRYYDELDPMQQSETR